MHACTPGKERRAREECGGGRVCRVRQLYHECVPLEHVPWRYLDRSKDRVAVITYWVVLDSSANTPCGLTEVRESQLARTARMGG